MDKLNLKNKTAQLEKDGSEGPKKDNFNGKTLSLTLQKITVQVTKRHLIAFLHIKIYSQKSKNIPMVPAAQTTLPQETMLLTYFLKFKKMIGQCERKKSITVSSNTIAAEGLGKRFFEFLCSIMFR